MQTRHADGGSAQRPRCQAALGDFTTNSGVGLMLTAVRIVAVMLWVVVLYGVAGGGFAYRENLPSGLYNNYMITVYTRLPPAPKGPSYCDILRAGAYSLVLRSEEHTSELQSPYVIS